MEKITVSSSLKFKEEIRQTIKKLSDLGIEGLFPNLDSSLSKDDLTLEVMKKLEDDHFAAIASSDALFVINPGGYIGTLVTAEMGYALGKDKPVYLSEKADDLGLDAMATGYVSLESLAEFLEL